MSDPNKLLETTVYSLSEKPLIGILLIETDEGMIDLAVNKTGAEQAIAELQKFVRGESEPFPLGGKSPN